MNVLVYVLLGLFLVALGAALRYRELAKDRWAAYEEVLDRAMAAEEDAGRVNAEMAFVKDTVTRLATRAVLATLTDDQVNQLTTAIGYLVTNILNAPDRLN